MNTIKYYCYKFVNELMPIYPLYLLMLQSRNMSVKQISLLLAIWSVPAVILEIPTGILADRWSRKYMLCIGCIFKASCYFIWSISGSFVLYAVGFAFWGIGGTFSSGSEEALIYDSLKIENKEEQFHQVLGRGHFLSGIGTILAAVTGGFIGARYGYQTALWLSLIFSLFGAGTAATMREINLYKNKSNEQKVEKNEGTLRGAVVFLTRRRGMLLFTLLSLLVVTTAGVLDEYDQLIVKEFGLTIKLIGIWTALRLTLTSVGAYMAGGLRSAIERLFKIKNEIFTIGIMCLSAAVFLVIAGWVNRVGIISFYGIYYLIMSASEVLAEDYIQHRVEEEGRSTVHSLIALAINLYGIICYGFLGFIISRYNLQLALLYCGIYILICTSVILVIYKMFIRKNNKI